MATRAGERRSGAKRTDPLFFPTGYRVAARRAAEERPFRRVNRRQRARATPPYDGSGWAWFWIWFWMAGAVLATAGAGAVTSASYETSAGHQCQTPSVMRRVKVNGTHSPRLTSTWRFARRSGGPQRFNTSSVV